MLRTFIRSLQTPQCSRLISTTPLARAERGINKVQLLGRVGNFPKEFTSPTTGKKLVVFPLATNANFKTKDADGNETLGSRTTWHSINVFKPVTQEVVMKHISKGSRVYLNGRLHNTKFNKEGMDRYATVIIADDIIHLQSARGVSEADQPPASGEEYTQTDFQGEMQEEAPVDSTIQSSDST